MELKKITLLITMIIAIFTAACTTNPRAVSPQQREFICKNLRGQIISNNEFAGTSAPSPSPMEGHSPNRSTQLYMNYDQYQCDT